MAIQHAIRFRAETVRTLAAGSIGAAYMGVGVALTQPIRQFFIQNLTDGTLMFSFDGVNDHFPLPRNGFYVSDITANASTTGGWFLAEGDRLYVKEVDTPTTGSVYFSAFYGT